MDYKQSMNLSENINSEQSELQQVKNIGECKRSRVNYNDLSKDELIELLKQYESKNLGKSNTLLKKSKKKFLWEGVSKRHVLLKFFYFGWDYHGYASSECGLETIEHHMFSALDQCCLIENRQSSNYNRCGRTDAGVSAFSQVISIDLRSKLKEPCETNCDLEMDYCKMLNRLLPTYIRCYAWCHIGSEVSARFDCTERSYNYFFPRGNLNIGLMEVAAKYLVGTHDFRNLCKMNVVNGVVNYERTIAEANIVPVTPIDDEPGFQMMKLEIRSRGFLWHQIRCIMAVLLLVGERNEQPSIIKELLDIKNCARKPQYPMATAYPLSLVTADYDSLNIHWNTSEDELKMLSGHLQGLWTEFAVKGSMVRNALDRLTQFYRDSKQWQRQIKLFNGIMPRNHVPLHKRPTCLSLEDRVKNVEEKKSKMNIAEPMCKKSKIEVDKK